MDRFRQVDSRRGLLCGLAAYGLWGLMPLYFRGVAGVRPLELLAHRIVWSVVFLGALLVVLRKWKPLIACLASPRLRWMLSLSTLLIACNWFVFIYGVSIGQVVQNSLGYFINPLLNILLGVVLFRERLRPARWLALGLATVGLVYLVVALGEVPWISFTLATSFALYGLIRKLAPVEALVGLAVETLLLLPVAIVFLLAWHGHGLMMMGTLGWQVDALLLVGGIVTAVPLWCFGEAAQQLRLSTLGFLQYLAPTLQFLLAVLWLGERFRPAQQVSFGLIWTALVIVSIDGLLARRTRLRTPAPVAVPVAGQVASGADRSIIAGRS